MPVGIALNLRTLVIVAVATGACRPGNQPMPRYEANANGANAAARIDAGTEAEAGAVVDLPDDANGTASNDPTLLLGPKDLFVSADGTLVAESGRLYVTRATDGTIARRSFLTFGWTARDFPGILVRNQNLDIVAVPTLRTLYSGERDLGFGDDSIAALVGDGELLVANGDALLRIPMPPDLGDITSFRAMADVARLRICYAERGKDSSSPEFACALYDSHSGARVGGMVPVDGATYADDERSAWFLMKDNEVVRLSLATGTQTARAPVKMCGSSSELASSEMMQGVYSKLLLTTQLIASSTGKLLIVLCAGDLVVLDGTTLRERRRIRHVVPVGRKDGDIEFFDGIERDDRTLVYGADDARLDLMTGRFLCNQGLWYFARVHAPVPPLPRCHSLDYDVGPTPFGRSKHYSLERDGESKTVRGGPRPIPLEKGAGPEVMGPGDAWFAYFVGSRIVGRALPGGEVIWEIQL
jgi:hypothetical protein